MHKNRQRRQGGAAREDPRSSILDPGSAILDPRSWIPSAVAGAPARLAFASIPAPDLETPIMHDAPTTTPHAGRHIPFKREGWGIAAFVCGLAVATALTAAYIHSRTYKHPTDVRMRAAGTTIETAPH
jgi:hypothetical protein